MATPLIHATSSAKRWGGTPEDYVALHSKMDCSKKYFPDNRHRILTHNMFFIFEVMIELYGEYITNSAGRLVSVKDICELHILEDYHMKYIPTPQDWIENLQVKSWMNNGLGEAPSSAKLRFPEGITVDRETELMVRKKTTVYID
jgi:hypothetical protein